MKNKIEINFRQPNTDRAVEIFATAIKFGYKPSVYIENKQKGYNKHLLNFGVNILIVDKIEDADFCIDTPKEYNFSDLFAVYETIETIQKRIDNTSHIENKSFNETSKALLKSAAEKLELSKDNVQSIVTLAEVIASMDGNTVHAEHIAEAIRYSVKIKIED